MASTTTNTANKKQEKPELDRIKPVGEAGSKALVFEGEMGRVRVSEDVVAKVAGLAVREVNGVHALVPFGAGQTITNLARTVVGDEMKDLGVRVEVGRIEAAVDVRIVTDYGERIPRIADDIRRNLEQRIKAMTGLKLKEVNIDVLDLFFADEPKKLPVETPPKPPRVR